MDDDATGEGLEGAFGNIPAIPEGRLPSKKERKAAAKHMAKQVRKIARTDQREARIREIVREELERRDIHPHGSLGEDFLREED